ncbi:MAG: sn-glycerol-1-phosphate dehydrogenase [Oscillospiraceae bacterium]|nr:sn-glycerol-1-phosphate dehydrogenase [Oscillospiraceae bacterium]MBO7728449.1 sn-glycerol-1-phosphate dehydrogenase [Oscillospiraceae bacterium]MBP5167731.1 sn-glycerol-1-phosphate dehydrogenase [Oscillospiraceae bacterium]
MKMYDTPQPVERYLNVELECDCGRTHFAPIKAINISSGALESLPGYVAEYGYAKPYILCDKITFEIAGKRCEELLKKAGFQPSVLIIRHMGFDEATLGEIVLNKPDDCDLMIGVGTGSITDMLRFSSFKLGLPCFTVATGAPMDGFSASVGIMNVNNLKATMPAHSTEVIIGDTDILKSAPYRMTIAGFADLIGKLNALDDWHLGAMINGDHYCKKIDELVQAYVDDILKKTDKIKARDPEAIGDVMNALLLTGATISLYGNSRPISGGEHHMSHYWEVLGEQRGKQYAMHGEQVAVGTVMALSVVEELSRLQPDFEKAREAAKQFDYDAWEANIRRTYGNAADAIVDLEKSSGKNDPVRWLQRLEVIEEKWPEIQGMLKKVYPAQELRRLLKDLGCPCDPKDIGITESVLKDTFMVCKETRNRYTCYQLAWDLDVISEISDKIIAELKQKNAI